MAEERPELDLVGITIDDGSALVLYNPEERDTEWLESTKWSAVANRE